MGKVDAMVDEKIKSKKVMMFSKSYCPFCKKAKVVFERIIEEGKLSPEDYEVMEIENDGDCDAIQQYLGKLTGASSVPRVFIKGKCVGGGDEVVALNSSQKLVLMLA